MGLEADEKQQVTEATSLRDPEDPFKPVAASKGKINWKVWRPRLCIATALLVAACLTAAIICAGVVPWQNYSEEVAPEAAIRNYYISVDEVTWTYTPGGENLCFANLSDYVNKTYNEMDILGTFKKAQYRAYTGEDFKTLLDQGDRWKHLGLLGPVIHAEAGDRIRIFLRNTLTVPVNLEPEGVSWSIEGLLYGVPPGRTVVYYINIPHEAGPPPDAEQSSLMYLYHSTINPTRHENGGLVGPIIVTRKGSANPDGTPKGIHREFITVFQIFNEIESVLAQKNANASLEAGWNTFRWAINGYSWCTLPGLDANVNETVRWYIGSLGTEDGMHNFHWHGNVLSIAGHNLDQFTAVPGTTHTADMYADNPGTWFYHCHVNMHMDGGMLALYRVHGPRPAPLPNSKEVVYYLGAIEGEWNYAPLDRNACGNNTGFDDTALTWLGEPTENKIGSRFIKARFVEYTDGTFTTIKERSPTDQYLGIVGPVFRAQVGQTLRIVFRNINMSFPASVHPHGVLYDKTGEGSPYNDGSSAEEHEDDVVHQGDTHTYIWEVPERAGPGPSDPSSVLWMYHSHVDETMDTNSGLMGGIIVTRANVQLHPDGTPADITREVVLFFSALDESASLYLEQNVAKYLPANVNTTELYASDDFHESNKHRGINGFMFCNMPKLQFEAGSRVRFHVMALGDITDLHVPNMGLGGNFLLYGHRGDSVIMSPGTMQDMEVTLTQPGTWDLECRVQEHTNGGMRAKYEVTNTFNTTSNGVVRTYYVQAEDVLWNYAPKGYVGCTQKDYAPRSARYLNKTAESIGNVYWKSMYREYTDATFTKPTHQPDFQGLMGPLLWAEIGDTIKVVFKNNLDFEVNFSPGGGLVAIGDAAAGESVAPGDVFEYMWVVPAEAGPAKGDLSTVAYGYTSTVDLASHQQLGLVGTIAIGKQGAFDIRGVPYGVDYFYPLLWEVFDENASPYLDRNLEMVRLDPATVDKNNDTFIESNMRHTVNGFMYCNMPPPPLQLGKVVRWIFVSIGSVEGLHAPMFVGQLLTDKDGPHEAVQLMPAVTRTYDMKAAMKGQFPMYCSVHDHVEAGMIASISVYQ